MNAIKRKKSFESFMERPSPTRSILPPSHLSASFWSIQYFYEKYFLIMLSPPLFSFISLPMCKWNYLNANMTQIIVTLSL